ncbi:MAG: helix-turn-helix domain-containing protein [Actinomycetota bacterium]|nr:helix-turn-helix domain-containing protein [Actinomycetota bacterium]
METYGKELEEYRAAPASLAQAAPQSVDAGDGSGPDTSVTLAINALQDSLEESARREAALSRQLDAMKRARRAGREWREVLANDANMHAVTVVGEIARRLGESGASFRRTLALALVREGDGLSEIARRFGISRQRVFNLVRASDGGSLRQR